MRIDLIDNCTLTKSVRHKSIEAAHIITALRCVSTDVFCFTTDAYGVATCLRYINDLMCNKYITVMGYNYVRAVGYCLYRTLVATPLLENSFFK